MVKSILTSLATFATCAAFAPASLHANTEQTAGIEHPVFSISPSYNAVGTLFSSNGFESYNNATLINQNGFVRSGGANGNWTVNATAGVGGTKGVVASGANTTWAYVANAYTPAANELVSASTDMAFFTGTTNAGAYTLDVYGNANRIGQVGLFSSSGNIVAAVTTKLDTTTGLPSPTGTLGTYAVTGNLNANTFYNFELRFNFSLKTFDVYSAGSLLLANCPFASANGNDTALSDADLHIIGATGTTSTGRFDNYVVSVLPAVPEPGTIAFIAGAGLAGVVFRRRRR